jgi:hypothetical protein
MTNNLPSWLLEEDILNCSPSYSTKRIPVEQTLEPGGTRSYPGYLGGNTGDGLQKDIVCGHCGDTYPTVHYAVDGEDLKMTLTCDEQCGSQTVYNFWKKSGNFYLDVKVKIKDVHNIV